MFLEKQPTNQIDYYKQQLQTVGSLSRLFSDSDKPYLHYRIAENLFCKSFGAENLSRSDIAIDATHGDLGIGLKTFIKSSNSRLEKVAEFNAHSAILRRLPSIDQVSEVIRLRNERIETSKTIYGLESMIYHCVVRDGGKMNFIEVPMFTIDTHSVEIIDINDKTLKFKDNNAEYSFSLSKSTLYKRFNVLDPVDTVPVDIFEDPFEILSDWFRNSRENEAYSFATGTTHEYVVLPLYSTRLDENGNKVVPEKSGLNQWNASGRPRSLEEVYIPIPAPIHSFFPGFFPDRDEIFNLVLPDNNLLQAKVCQDGSKALMSNPNVALGKWMLRDVLRLNEGELLTYKKLQDIGLDSVVVTKLNPGKYKIDFAKLGTYEQFSKTILMNSV